MSSTRSWALLAVLVGCLLGATPGRAQEEKDWQEVIRRLTQQVHRMPRQSNVREQLAVAHNNYAVSLASQGKWTVAAQHLEKAIRLSKSDEQFRLNLSSIHLSQAHHAYDEHRFSEAREAAQKSVEFDPEQVAGYALLGEIEYDTQRLKQAKAAWKRALELDPSRSDVARRLEQVSEELPLESQFGRIAQAYFDLRYEGRASRPVGFDVRNFLRQARRRVGSDFAYWPRHKIIVLLYNAESFRALRQETPEWLAGQFDGKIRLPLPSLDLDLEMVKQIIFHEYTHALVHELARGQCPTWFNEGLAEYEGSRHGPRRTEQLAAVVARDRLLDWDQLDRQFSRGLPAEQVALGYQQSHSIVRYLVERYGFWRIRRILKALAGGAPLEQALAEEFHIKFERLHANWRRWLPKFLESQS